MGAIKIFQIILLKINNWFIISSIFLIKDSKSMSNLYVYGVFQVLIGTCGCSDMETLKDEGKY